MNRAARLRWGAVVIAASFGLAACGNSGSKTASSAALPAASQVFGAPVAGSAAGAATAAGADAPAAAAGSVGQSAADSVGKSAGKAALQTPDVVRTATLSISVADVTKAADSLNATVKKLGGRVDQDNRTGGDTPSAQLPSAQLIVRLQPGVLAQAIAAADKLGTETSQQTQGQDVTASVADIGARVSALRTSVQRLQTLLGSSSNLNDLISLESQLTQRQASLDSIVAQQRALSDQIALASLTVNLQRQSAVLAKAHPKPIHLTGFSAALSTGLHGLLISVRVVVAGLGYGLPFLALALVIVLPLLWIRSRRRVRLEPEDQVQVG